MIHQLINLVYPPICLVCEAGIDKGCLCQNCRDKIRFINPSVNKIIYKKDGIYYNKVYSMALYEGVLKKMIHLLKYKHKLGLLKVFSRMLVEFVQKHLSIKQYDFIVPVPLHGTKLREREFNQAGLLARSLAKRFGVVFSSGNLRKTRPTLSQSNLKKTDRLQNLTDVFRARNAAVFRGKKILLVDDVFTTGSTANECARVLLSSGAKSVSVLTVARGE